VHNILGIFRAVSLHRISFSHCILLIV